MEAISYMKSTPLRLLDLPLEIRLQIYEDALTSLDKTLEFSRKDAKCLKQNAGPAISLLRTCSQVYQEASSILCNKNTMLAVVQVQRTPTAVVMNIGLPQCTLSNVRHAFVVLDGRYYCRATYKDIDFRPFQAMTALKTLGIAIATRKGRVYSVTWANRWATLLKYAIERVPSSCAIRFGSCGEVEKRFVEKSLELGAPRIPPLMCNHGPEVPGEVLSELAKGLACVRGCKSGSERDYRFEPE